jgi:hypothetical protein
MLPGVVLFDSQVLLRHWILEVGVLPSLFPARIHQASPRIFLVYVPPEPWCISPMFFMLEQGVLPPLRTMHSFHPTRASTPVDQLRL